MADLEARIRRDALRESVFTRDGRKCQFPHGARWPLESGRPPVCWGVLTPHHLWKASAGGRFEMDNLLTMRSACNDWVEDHPEQARELGLAVAKGVTAEEAQRRRRVWGSSW